MAQHSKKDQIAEAALTLFLANGFKGTSVDMVVKAAGVSKPTVYNHFPDKAALMKFVMQKWLAESAEPNVEVSSVEEFEQFISNSLLSDEALGLYALVIGEGRRFEDAKALFIENFENRLRVEISRVAIEKNLDERQMQQMFSHALFGALLR